MTSQTSSLCRRACDKGPIPNPYPWPYHLTPHDNSTSPPRKSPPSAARAHPSFTLRITLTTSTQARRPTESARDTDASSQSHSHELKIDVGWIALDPGVPIHTCVARVRFHFDQRGKADILTLAKKSSPVEFDGTRGTRRRLHEHRYSSAVYFCAPSKRIGDI
jgi:hypothetical protein